MIDKYKSQCTGCGACSKVCPKNCITMEFDKEGFLYPVIDKEKCIDCGLCNKNCPIEKSDFFNSDDNIYYGLINKDQEQLKGSTSGGFFISAAKYVIDNGGYVVGCIIDNCIAKHIITNDYEMVKKMQGSKYVQSLIGDVYTQTKVFLEKGINVLFTGTPCQVAGLYSFLNSKYNNLVTVEIICHGVPSNKFLLSCVKYYEDKYNSKFSDVFFREKRNNLKWGENYGLTLTGNEKIKYISAKKDAYYRSFMNGASYRMCCYSCKYAKKKRVSDITIGDFWGVEQENPLIKSNMGVSVISINSDIGKSFFEKIKDNYQIFKTEYSIASKKNKQLISPTPMNSEREVIYERLEIRGYKYLQTKLMYKYFFKNIIPNNVKEKMKNIYKNIKE